MFNVYYHLVMELNGNKTSDRLDATFAALADPTRRAILARLATGEASVNELAEPFNMTQPAISKHLRVLERAGLISTAREAQRRPRRLEAAPLAQATAWLERYRQFWEERFQRLDALLVDLQKENAPINTSANTAKKTTSAPKKDLQPEGDSK
jgi:DNA-binding transcriptional ArsR family regulator